MSDNWEQYRADKYKPEEDEFEQYRADKISANSSHISPLQAEGQYLKGLGKGALSQLDKFATSALNILPGAHFKPAYNPEEAQSEFEASGQRMGPNITDFAALLPPLKAAKLIGEVPEGASLIAKLLGSGKKVGAVGGAGALEGLAVGEPDRFEKAKEFGIGSAGAEAIGQLLSKGLSYRPSAQHKEAESQLRQAIENQAQQKEALESAKGTSLEEVKLDRPSRMIPRIEDRSKQISDAIDALNYLPIEEFPSTVTHEAYTQLPKLAEDNLKDLNKNISAEMGAGKNPDKPLAETTMQYFEGPKVVGKNVREGGLRTEIGNMFNEVRDSMKDTRINISNKISDQTIDTMAEALLKAAHKGTEQKIFTPHQMKYARESIKNDLKKEKGKSIDAQNYFDTYREIESNQGKLISKLNKAKNGSINLSNKEIKDLKREAASMQTEMIDMESNLKNQLDPTIFEKFESAKNRWANEYAPVRRNPIYEKMRDKGTVDSSDLMDEIRGEDKGSVILRRYFQSNPKAAELLANNQYAKNPMGLQELTPYQREFINPKLTPKISKYIEDQRLSLRNVEKANQQADHFKQISESIQTEQKRHNELLQERQKIERQIPQWKKEISNLGKHSKILREQIKNKNLSDKKVIEAKENLKAAEKKKERLNKLLIGAAKYGSIYEYAKHKLAERNKK